MRPDSSVPFSTAWPARTKEEVILVRNSLPLLHDLESSGVCSTFVTVAKVLAGAGEEVEAGGVGEAVCVCWPSAIRDESRKRRAQCDVIGSSLQRRIISPPSFA